MSSRANTDGRDATSAPKLYAEPSASEEAHPHQWYDDDFCKGGGTFIGEGQTSVACPGCGEQMDVDADGYLFKHRPRIPKSTG